MGPQESSGTDDAEEDDGDDADMEGEDGDFGAGGMVGGGFGGVAGEGPNDIAGGGTGDDGTAGARIVRKKRKPTENDLKEAVRVETLKMEVKVQEKDEEIQRLVAEIEDLKASLAASGKEKKVKPKKEVAEPEPDTEKEDKK